MKGKSFRRRQRNVVAAKSANLYKAQFGKASKWDALPEPPQARDMTRLTRAERKTKAMLDLMASQRETHVNSSLREGELASCIAKDDPVGFTAGKSSQMQDVATDIGVAPVHGGHEARTHVSKASRKRKMNLDERKKRRKAKKALATTYTSENKYKEQPHLTGTGSKPNKPVSAFHAEAIPFGEVAAQPPEVNLKRRHWGQQESDRGTRHADVLKKYLKIGEARLKGFAKGTSQYDLDADLQRDQAVGAYRAVKASTRSKGNATMRSLKALVQVGSARPV
eukprot:jgi/Ulvmu1/10510/UM064_0048.1